MQRLRLIYSRLYGLLFKSRIERDMEEELRFHLRMRSALNMQAGLGPEEAKRQAARSFGNLSVIVERCRDIKGGGVVETILSDLRYGARMLARSPVFTAVAVLTLGLGVGANSAIFSVVNAVLLRPLPFYEPDKLVRIYTKNEVGLMEVASWRELVAWQEQSTCFAGLAAFSRDGDMLAGPDGPEPIDTADVSPGFFELLHVNPILGRTFSPGDQPGHRTGPGFTVPTPDAVSIMAEGFWRERYGADPNIIGRSLVVDGYPTTVVGIVPDGFAAFVGRPRMWFPWARDDSNDRRYPIVGRLKSGVAIEQANAEMQPIAARMREVYPDTNFQIDVVVLPLRDTLVGNVRLMLWIMLGAVGLVLLIACANVANLLLARAATRWHELAVRSALGASRARLVRQLLTEGLVLAALGGVVALVIAWAGIQVLIKLSPPDLPRLNEVRLDGPVIGFTIALALGATLLFGLAPALRGSAVSLTEALKEAGRGAQGGRRQNRMRSLLAASELAFSLVLLIACGLLIRSLYRLAAVDPGFDPHNLLTAEVSLLEPKDKTTESRRAFYDQIAARVDGLPGSVSAAVCQWIPLNGGGNNSWEGIVPEGTPFSPQAAMGVMYRRIGPGFFETLRIPLLGGREFNRFDRDGSPSVVIITETLARQLWPGRDPIGKRVFFEADQAAEIVGVAGDVKPWGLDSPNDPAVYVPFAQSPAPFLMVAARSEAKGANLAGAIKDAVRSVDPELPAYGFKTMEEVLDYSLIHSRFNLLLLSTFGGLALLLAAVGTYGVISYGVAERTREIGIRMALGATRSDVAALVMGQAVRFAVVGCLFGLAGAFALTRVIESFLFRVTATDPPTFIAVPLFLVLVALLASYLPARRAVRIDPMVALRQD